MPVDPGGSISDVPCWIITAGCRQQLGQCFTVWHTKLPSHKWTLPRGWSLREKHGEINDQENVMAPERKTSGYPMRGCKPSNEGGDREESSQSENRTSVKKVCRCVKDSREEGGGGSKTCEPPEAIKVLFLVHWTRTCSLPPALSWLAGSTMRPDSQFVCKQENH